LIAMSDIRIPQNDQRGTPKAPRFFILRMMARAPAVEDLGKKTMSDLSNRQKTMIFFRQL
jgi:hypothetical protein